MYESGENYLQLIIKLTTIWLEPLDIAYQQNRLVQQLRDFHKSALAQMIIFLYGTEKKITRGRKH